MKRYIILFSSALILLFSFSGFTTGNGFEISKQIEIFISFYKKLNQNYVDETNPAELMDKAIRAITDDMDPYTKVWSEQDIIASKIRSSGQYTRIGAMIVTKENGRIFIGEPIKNFPADKSGLKAGDEIIKIDDILLSEFNGEANELLMGEAGSKVVISYVRQGKKLVTSVNRSKIEVDAVPYYKLLPDNSAYIVLRKFNQKASSQTIAALKELKARGADKVILDLRGNPGGLLNEAVNVCNIFIPKGELIVSTKSFIEGNNKVYKTKKDPIDLEIPLVVLVNGRSASASEIVSGVMQDLDRGVVVGARSFGKGLVQTHKSLVHNTKLKITSSRYHMPSKRCIQALDYWHKDKYGKPIRTKGTDYKPFKTLNSNRTVYDGGGINPDVEVELSKRSTIAKALLSNKIIFDYGTKYFYENKVSDLNGFKFKSSDYQDFLNYLKSSNFKFETKTETSLEDAMTYAIKEKIDKSIDGEYQSLLKKIEAFKQTSLKTQEKEISQLLSDEIVTRYFYSEGKYEYNSLQSEEIKTAQSILGDAKRYNSILGR